MDTIKRALPGRRRTLKKDRLRDTVGAEPERSSLKELLESAPFEGVEFARQKDLPRESDGS